MGYHWTNCVLIGANIGFEPFEDEYEDVDAFNEKYRDYLNAEEEGEIVYLEDKLGGEYFIVGEILFRADSSSEVIPLFDFDFEEKRYKEQRQRVKEYIKETFDLDVTPKIMVLTHLD